MLSIFHIFSIRSHVKWQKINICRFRSTDSIIHAVIRKRNQIKCIKCNYVLGKTRSDKIPWSTIRQTPTGSQGKNITFAVIKPSFPSHRRPFFSHGFVIVRKDRNTTRNLLSINYIYHLYSRSSLNAHRFRKINLWLSMLARYTDSAALYLTAIHVMTSAQTLKSHLPSARWTQYLLLSSEMI